MRWDEFTAAGPDLAKLAQERFEQDQVVMLGTIRADGRARLSPCEVDFAAGRVLFGMMWQSPKARDLLRDARLTVHSVPSDKTNAGGDILRMATVNGAPGLVMRDGDGVLTVIAFTIDAGRITAMDVMRNPDKLTTVPDPG